MNLPPFLKNALWVAPASFLLAWATPRSGTDADQQETVSKPTRSPHARTSSPQISPSSSIPSQLPELSSVSDCQEALAKLESRSDLHPLIADALRDRALRAWLALDPVGALAHAESKIVVWGESFGKELFRVWLDLDPASALEHFNLTSPALRTSLFQNFYNQVSELDPQRTLEEMKLDYSRKAADPLGFYDVRGRVVTHAYKCWAATDPRGAIEFYQKNLASGTSLGFSSESLPSIFRTWGESDPLAAREYFQKIQSETSDSEWLPRNVSMNLWDSIEQALPPLVTPDPLSGNRQSDARTLVNTAESLTFSDPARAVALYLEGQSLAGIPENPLVNSVAGFPSLFYHNTFQMLNVSDAARAHELLQSVPEKHRAFALGGILTHEFSVDPAGAIEKARDYYQDPETSVLMAEALTKALTRGDQNPTEVIAALPDFRQHVHGSLLKNWTQRDPEAAATFLTEELNNNSDYELKSTQALSEIAAASPEFTAQWLHTLPEGQVQTDAAVALAANWSNFDRPATVAWIAQLPAGPLKEAATNTLSRQPD